jgi:hypothetical protein
MVLIMNTHEIIDRLEYLVDREQGIKATIADPSNIDERKKLNTFLERTNAQIKALGEVLAAENRRAEV